MNTGLEDCVELGQAELRRANVNYLRQGRPIDTKILACILSLFQ